MAATGKKGKKAKWNKVNMTVILAEPTAIPTTNSWADADDDTESYGYGTQHRAPIVLPSASRAACGGLAVDEDAIPRRPPYVAHISNLPYDVEESAIADLFAGLKIVNLRIPREGDRLKGFGYIDFEDREDLINAMKMTDPVVGGRRIRIDVSTTNNDGRMGRGRSDRDRDYDPERTMGDWRSGPRAQPEGPPRAARDSGRDRDAPMTREGMREREPMTREGMREREPMTREGMREREPMTREGMREREPMTREGMRERDSSADNRPGGWRDGERPAAEPARTPYGGRDSFGRDRERDRDGYGQRERGYGGRDGFRTAERDGERGGGGFGNRDRGSGFGARGFGDRDRDPPPRDEKPRERPKLNLLPRTVPREEAPPPAEEAPEERPAAKPVPKEKVFGAAKPVDTAAKEREIEERLRKQEEEARRAAEEKERWGRKNDDSGDRRAGGRRDDRPRDSRSYNSDRRRDYSRDKDRRPDDRERRDSRNRRDYSGDRRDSPDRRRDYSGDRRKDSPDRRRDSPDRRREYSGDRRRDSPERRRESPERRRESPERRRDYSPDRNDHRNGKEERGSRSRDRRDEAERPLPKLKEIEKPNFVGSNKFSFLEEAADDASD